MNTIPYFPGCSLKDTSTAFETSAKFAMEKLGLALAELDRWNCCGTVSSLTEDDLMHHLASVRNFVRVQDLEEKEFVALCAMCYNTLARTAQRINTDDEERNKINLFMDRESDYDGNVEIRHLLQVLRDRIGWDALADQATIDLGELKVGCYYGCTLVRPKSVGIDDSENPTIMGDALEAVGADPISFPFSTECCGTYQVVDRPDLALEQSFRILQSATRAGADVIATACPLCQHNLVEAQRALSDFEGIDRLDIVYFTELLAAALGGDSSQLPERLTKGFQPTAEAQAVQGGN